MGKRMFRFRSTRTVSDSSLLASRLLDQDSFYNFFIYDLKKARSQVIIESPFITLKRTTALMPVFRMLSRRGVRLVINTKPLSEHEYDYRLQAKQAIGEFQRLGAIVLLTGGHHRKLVIIDGSILYEGSLNVLSQNESCEIMRRIDSELLAGQMLDFLHLDKFVG